MSVLEPELNKVDLVVSEGILAGVPELQVRLVALEVALDMQELDPARIDVLSEPKPELILQ